MNSMDEKMIPDPNYQSTAILKELSDIKSNLAVNSTETINIKATITEIKDDIKEIKNDAIPRREFNDFKKDITELTAGNGREIESLKEFKWKLVGIVIATSFFATILGQYLLKIIKNN